MLRPNDSVIARPRAQHRWTPASGRGEGPWQSPRWWDCHPHAALGAGAVRRSPTGGSQWRGFLV